jgi:FAD:protein FMN transferase
MVSIRIDACPQADAALDAAFAAIRRVHDLMSFHCPHSELSLLNRQAHKKTTPVSEWTYAVIARALELSRASGGLFDCSIAPYLTRLGLLPAPHGQTRQTARGKRLHPRAPATFSAVQLLAGNRIRFACPLWLDLGGIGKGFAVDRAVEALQAHGIASACVNAGGDLRVYGDSPTPIRVRLPDAPGQSAPLMNLQNGAIATSAAYPATLQDAESAAGSVIDPRSGARCGSGMSVSVHAADCVTADALTKVVAISEDADHPVLARMKASALLLRTASAGNRSTRPAYNGSTM